MAGMFTSQTYSSNHYQCIYPNYIDKSKSLKEGRRITACKAVDRPVLPELIEVLTSLNIPHVVENKAYSRDWMVRGRIRVNLHAVSDDTVNTSMSASFSSYSCFPRT